MRKVIESIHFRQFVKFGIVGFGNSMIDFGMYLVGTRFLHLHYLFANTLSWVCAVFFSFTMNKFWTFRATQPGAAFRQYIKFFMVSVVSLIVSLFLLHVLVDIMHMHDIVAKIATIAVVVFWNFFMNKFWTFSS